MHEEFLKKVDSLKTRVSDDQSAYREQLSMGARAIEGTAPDMGKGFAHMAASPGSGNGHGHGHGGQYGHVGQSHHHEERHHHVERHHHGGGGGSQQEGGHGQKRGRSEEQETRSERAAKLGERLQQLGVERALQGKGRRRRRASDEGTQRHYKWSQERKR